jgi:hypothetical protein
VQELLADPADDERPRDERGDDHQLAADDRQLQGCPSQYRTAANTSRMHTIVMNGA